MDVRDLDSCLHRGAVFLWHRYDRLDDPAYETKAKFLILINAFLPDDLLYYLLTTSQLAKLQSSPFVEDLVIISAGSYPFLDRDTAINVGTLAQTPPLDAIFFRGAYYDREITYVGSLSDADVRRLDDAITSSVRVPKELKRLTTAW